MRIWSAQVQVEIHNNLLNDYADTSVRDPGQSPPPVKRPPPRQTILPVGGRVSMYSV